MNIPSDRVRDLFLERDERMAKQISFRWRGIELVRDRIFIT